MTPRPTCRGRPAALAETPIFQRLAREMGEVRLARRFGVSRHVARRALDRLGPRPQLPRNAPPSPSQLEELRTLWDTPLPLRTVARRIGLARETARKYGRDVLHLPYPRYRGVETAPARWRCYAGTCNGRLVLEGATCPCGARSPLARRAA